MATSHETRAAAATGPVTTAQHGGKGSEAKIKPFYEIERRKQLDGGAMAERCHCSMRRGASAIRRDGDDATVIFRVPGQGVFRVGQTTRLISNQTKLQRA